MLDVLTYPAQDSDKVLRALAKAHVELSVVGVLKRFTEIMRALKPGVGLTSDELSLQPFRMEQISTNGEGQASKVVTAAH
ncbi:hypothetical protein FJTKL_03595 [Diaporthe vaccinii]|uniref:Uncharacterized protein n=1 Tax=Diaporthe vaccinii TaxID=105482 RepID=A0ABR4DV08_9PEZI